MVETKEILLAVMGVYAQTRIPKGILNLKPQVFDVLDGYCQDVILSLSGYVLSQDAGRSYKEFVVDQKTVEVPNFPKWLPRRLKNRWTKTETVCFSAELEVTPKWTFPHANDPNLGREISKFGYARVYTEVK